MTARRGSDGRLARAGVDAARRPSATTAGRDAHAAERGALALLGASVPVAAPGRRRVGRLIAPIDDALDRDRLRIRRGGGATSTTVAR